MRASPFRLRPTVQFEPVRTAGRRQRFGLGHRSTVYHHSLRDRRTAATVLALRCQSSRFRFPELGRLASTRARRTSIPLGLLRAPRG